MTRGTSKHGGGPVVALVPVGKYAGQPAIALRRAINLIGGAEVAHVHLKSRSVDPVHAMVVVSGGRAYVRDVAGRAGVTVTGAAVVESELSRDDVVGIGSFEFRVSMPDAGDLAAAEQTPPPATFLFDGREVPMEGRVLVIGRRSASDVVLTDPQASRVHAAVVAVGGRYVLRDLGSRTGTMVNADVVHERELEDGDEIHIASHAIFCRLAPTAGVGAPAGADLVDFEDSVLGEEFAPEVEPAGAEKEALLEPNLADESAPGGSEDELIEMDWPREEPAPVAAEDEPLPLADLPEEPPAKVAADDRIPVEGGAAPVIETDAEPAADEHEEGLIPLEIEATEPEVEVTADEDAAPAEAVAEAGPPVVAGPAAEQVGGEVTLPVEPVAPTGGALDVALAEEPATTAGEDAASVVAAGPCDVESAGPADEIATADEAVAVAGESGSTPTTAEAVPRVLEGPAPGDVGAKAGEVSPELAELPVSHEPGATEAATPETVGEVIEQVSQARPAEDAAAEEDVLAWIDEETAAAAEPAPVGEAIVHDDSLAGTPFASAGEEQGPPAEAGMPVETEAEAARPEPPPLPEAGQFGAGMGPNQVFYLTDSPLPAWNDEAPFAAVGPAPGVELSLSGVHEGPGSPPPVEPAPPQGQLLGRISIPVAETPAEGRVETTLPSVPVEPMASVVTPDAETVDSPAVGELELPLEPDDAPATSPESGLHAIKPPPAARGMACGLSSLTGGGRAVDVFSQLPVVSEDPVLGQVSGPASLPSLEDPPMHAEFPPSKDEPTRSPPPGSDASQGGEDRAQGSPLKRKFRRFLREKGRNAAIAGAMLAAGVLTYALIPRRSHVLAEILYRNLDRAPAATRQAVHNRQRALLTDPAVLATAADRATAAGVMPGFLVSPAEVARRVDVADDRLWPRTEAMAISFESGEADADAARLRAGRRRRACPGES